MTAAADEKAGWCGNCRGGSHALCMSARCTCPGERKHANRPSASASPAPLTPVRDPQPAAALPKARKAVTTKPVIELVVEDPPRRLSSRSDRCSTRSCSSSTTAWSRAAGIGWRSCRHPVRPRRWPLGLSKHEVTGRRKLEWRAADLKVFVKGPE